MPPLYHWSPRDRREAIIRRGLRPSTPTLVEDFSDQPVGPRKLRPSVGVTERNAVCLGTSPEHAWMLSGAIWSKRGEEWDLWQVETAKTDNILVMRCDDNELGEFRVLNRLPKTRVWHVAVRTVGVRRWSHA